MDDFARYLHEKRDAAGFWPEYLRVVGTVAAIAGVAATAATLFH